MHIRECDVYTFLLSNRNEYWNKKDFMEEEEKNFLLQSGNGSLSLSLVRTQGTTVSLTCADEDGNTRKKEEKWKTYSSLHRTDRQKDRQKRHECMQ
jgi:hypothetical protein